MKIILVSIILICGALHVQSQSEYRKAFIVTTKVDTITGYVDYRSRLKNSEYCKFKIQGDAEETIYTPNDLLAYGFPNDRHFESREISIDSISRKRVFLEVLVAGDLTLYKMGGFYYVDKNDSIYQLGIERKEVTINDEKVIKNYKRYRGILSYLMSDCQGFQDKINRLGLKEKALTQLVNAYNQCKGDTATVYKESKPWLKFNPGVGVGINSSTIKFESFDPSTEYLASGFDKSNTVSIGMDVEVSSPRLNERMSFYLGAYYLKSEYIAFNTYNRSFTVVTNDVEIALTELKVPLAFRYTFPEGLITPFFSIGGSNTFHFTSSSSWISNRDTRGVMQRSEKEAITIIEENQYGFWGGIGVKSRINQRLMVRLEARYEKTSGLSISNSLAKSQIENFQIIFGLSF